MLLLFLITSCVTTDPSIKKDQSQNIPEFNPIISMPFEITWLVVRDCVDENELPILYADNITGEIKTELVSDAMGYTGYSITISVNKVKKNLQKIYISSYWESIHILLNGAAKSMGNKKKKKLEDCITAKINSIKKEEIKKKTPKQQI